MRLLQGCRVSKPKSETADEALRPGLFKALQPYKPLSPLLKPEEKASNPARHTAFLGFGARAMARRAYVRFLSMFELTVCDPFWSSHSLKALYRLLRVPKNRPWWPLRAFHFGCGLRVSGLGGGTRLADNQPQRALRVATPQLPRGQIEFQIKFRPLVARWCTLCPFVVLGSLIKQPTQKRV